MDRLPSRRRQGIGLRDGRGRLPDGPEVVVHAEGEEEGDYLCVNADESEPGTFKDREIMRWTRSAC